MNRRTFLRSFVAGAATLSVAGCGTLFSQENSDKRPPNFVIVFTDDQGYSDLGCYGAEGFKTPHIDRMAAEGVRFTNFYVAASVCTPSRAALLTGCYPKRVGLHVGVLFPQSKTGLNPDEITIADMLKDRGYATGCFGKWHLGHHDKFLPTRQGFDQFYGLPYSNDMSRDYLKRPNYPRLPLMRQEEVIEYEPNQNLLTKSYTDQACKFIRDNRSRPFFVYLPHSMPHRPIHASKVFQGKAEYGLYGDVIQEIDASVGQVLKTLKETGNDENTLVFFCSDNGPVAWVKNLGTCRPLRGSKAKTWEGGMREPTNMWWPGKIPPGKTSKEVATTMDVLPTIAHLVDTKLPPDHIIDGKNIWDLVTHPETEKSAYDAFYYYGRSGEIEAVRQGKWKLHIAKKHRGWDEKKQGPFKPFLVDLENDISEITNLADKHPDRVEKLTKMMTDFDAELTKTARPVGAL